MMIDEGENADFLTVKLEVCGKCIRLILVYGPQERFQRVLERRFGIILIYRWKEQNFKNIGL